MRACTLNRRLAAVMLAGVLVAHAASALELPATLNNGSAQLTIATTSLDVAPIRLDDIADQAVQPLLGDARRATAMGTQLVSPGTIRVPPVRLTVTRELHRVWRMQLPAGRTAVNVGVTARIESLAGPSALASDERAGESLPIKIIPRAPRTVSTDTHRQTLEGDVLLEFDLRNLRVGGHYSGRLVITAEGT
jgi:hypothetical protein